MGAPGRGPQALIQALARLSGLWLPAAAWGGGVLPLRVEDYHQSMLEKLVATGQFLWVARGTGEEMKLAFRPTGSEFVTSAPKGREEQPPDADATQEETILQEVLGHRGALFLAQIVQQTGLSPTTSLEALEKLMAAGLVTNDTLSPVRYFAKRRPENRRYQLTQQVLAEMGRWSLIEPVAKPDPEHAAELLLNRYGLVTRDFATRDCSSWDDLLRVYERWEAIGRVRRGYFVEDLGGLQYALPEAVERLRLPVEEAMPEYWAILRCDPANPYGSVLAMPETGMQAEILVLRRGQPVLAAGGKKIRLAAIGELTGEELGRSAAVLGCPGQGQVSVAEYKGQPVWETEAGEILKGLGFERGYKEMVRWSE